MEFTVMIFLLRTADMCTYFLHLEMLTNFQRENTIYSSSDPQHQTGHKKKRECVFLNKFLFFILSVFP